MSIIGSIKRLTAPEAIATWRAKRARIAAAAFAPKSMLSLSQWADRFRYMSADLGEPGLYRTDRTPYLRAPMDAITDPRVRRVTVMKSARIGATQALVLNPIGYCIHQEPKSLVVGLPTIGDSQKFSTSLLQPMIDDTPVLAERINTVGSKKRSTMTEKGYAGGTLYIVGTQSPRALRMVHGQWVLKSEIDAWEGSSGDDGDPYNLIDKRAGAYGSPKFIEESTPLVRETSRIEPAFQAGTMEYYHVPCPHCSEFQRLEWGGPDVDHGIKWGRKDDGSPDLENVYYVCLSGCEILETEKHGMVSSGKWVATHPERRAHRSFHLNALVSPFDGARWSLLVEEWYQAERKPEKIRVFVNTVLGETFVEAGEEVDGDRLTQRRDEGTWWSKEAPVPIGAAVLTRSVDTQGDRLETAVWAWGEDEECWLIDHEILPGDPATSDPWDALDERVGYGNDETGAPRKAKTYRHAGGRVLAPRVTMIDAGGHHSKEVKKYTRRRRAKRVFAIFGATQPRAPLLGNPMRTGRVIQYPIGVFAAKEALIKRLDKIDDPGPGYLHLPPWTTQEMIDQLAAEKLIVRGDKRVFKKTRARNEMIDLWVYALAGLYQLGEATMKRLGTIALQLAPAEETPAPTPDAAPSPDPLPDDVPERSVSRPRRGWMRGGRGFR